MNLDLVSLRRGFCALTIAGLIPVTSAAGQLLEVVFQVEASPWPARSLAVPAERATVRCVFSTNTWLIEAPYGRSKEALWCTGTNIIKHTVYVEDPTEEEERRVAASNLGYAPERGERFTTVHDKSGPCRFYGLTHLAWLAFCSGSFLKSEGRTLLPPVPVGYNKSSFSDKTQLFDDGLNLPQRVEIYSVATNLISLFVVKQSTNVVGWNIPLRFELTQFNEPANSTPKEAWHASAAVTSIRQLEPPIALPEGMDPPRQLP